MNILGKKVVLRAIEPEDTELIRGMFNDPEIENLVGGWAFPISHYAQSKWLESHYNDQNNHRFVIETKADGAVGVATLTDIDWKNRSAFHGIKLAKDINRGKGIGKDAVMAIMRYAFDELQLHRLDGAWFDFNLPSKSMYKKCGWKEEGVRKKYIYKKGTYHDLVLAGILEEEYYELIRENNYWEE